MEQIDDGEEDHNVLAVFVDENLTVDDNGKRTLTEFVSHVFDHLPSKVVEPGDFYDKERALSELEKARD